MDSGFQLVEQITAGLVVIEMRQCGDYQLGGYFASGVAAHTVGQGQQPCARVHRVLVVGAYETTVAAGGVAEGQGHGRSSITVLPTCTGVPMGTRTAVVTFDRSR